MASTTTLSFTDESDLDYLTFPANCYWIQVREPAEVVLNYTTRDLTCTPGRQLLEPDSVVTPRSPFVAHSCIFVDKISFVNLRVPLWMKRGTTGGQL